jgi:hypothetical protein
VGYVNGGAIHIGADAAGSGWFVASTPLGDLEYFSDGDGILLALDDDDAAERMDLMSVVMREQAEAPGLGDQNFDSSVVLEEGVRSLPSDGAKPLTQAALEEVAKAPANAGRRS